jgi:membrane-associated phospholipid phosphatase
MIPTIEPIDRPAGSSPLPGRLAAIAAVLACAGALALGIDIDVALWCKGGNVPRGLMRFLNFSEVFGHGMGVATILLAAAVLDPGLGQPWSAWRRWAAIGPVRLPVSTDFLRLVATAFAGGIMANVVKATLFDRVRPRAADLTAAASAFSTFGASLAAAINSHSDLNSFPSGHAATAAGLAAALAWRYPRGRWLFVFLAMAAAAQRVASSAHYPSDVFFGASLGLVCAAAVINATRRSPSASG